MRKKLTAKFAEGAKIIYAEERRENYLTAKIINSKERQEKYFTAKLAEGTKIIYFAWEREITFCICVCYMN